MSNPTLYSSLPQDYLRLNKAAQTFPDSPAEVRVLAAIGKAADAGADSGWIHLQRLQQGQIVQHQHRSKKRRKHRRK